MATIRRYRPGDIHEITDIFRDNFTRFIMKDATPDGGREFIESLDDAEDMLRRFEMAPIVLVAVREGRVIGFARGYSTSLINLFVRPDCHRQGLGAKLLARFEKECVRLGSRSVHLYASLHAVEFYRKQGYRRTTGVRNRRGLMTQPMRKALPTAR